MVDLQVFVTYIYRKKQEKEQEKEQEQEQEQDLEQEPVLT